MIDAEKIKRAVNDKMFPHWVDDLVSAINAELERINGNVDELHAEVLKLDPKPANEMPTIERKDILVFVNGNQDMALSPEYWQENSRTITEIWRETPGHYSTHESRRSYKRIWSRKP